MFFEAFKKAAVSGALFVLVLPAVLDAQTRGEELLNSYERNFVRSDLPTKNNILRDAATDEAAPEFYGPLCALALQFALDNAKLFRQDADMINLAVLSLQGLGAASYRPAAEKLLQLCLYYEDNVIRHGALKILPRLIKGNLEAYLLRIVVNNPPEEKLAALYLFLAMENPGPEARGRMAESALETGLSFKGTQGKEQIRKLCRVSLGVIQESRWVRSTPAVLKYYNQSLVSYRTDPSYKDDLLASIDCLGALKNTDAAQALILQMGLYNDRSSSLSSADMELVLAMVQSLGNLGYKASYDVLYQAGTRSYPDEIKTAARNALDSLKW